MAATKEEISNWFDKGKDMEMCYMVIESDRFEYSDYPVYFHNPGDTHRFINKTRDEFTRIMEVYDLRKDKEHQLAQNRAWEAPTIEPSPDSEVKNKRNISMGTFGASTYEQMKINDFGVILQDAFGAMPYQVGSSIVSKTWNDIDIVVILEDNEYEKSFGKPNDSFYCAKWRAHCRAWMALGKDMTGLPIDFKIQHMTTANRLHDGPRYPIGLKFNNLFEPEANMMEAETQVG